MRLPLAALMLCAALSAVCVAQTAPPAPAQAAPAGPSPASPLNQFIGGPGPDGLPAAVVTNGCVVSKYFGFSYRLPPGMTHDDLSALPAGGTNISPTDFIFFVADRRYQMPNFYHDDVIEAAAAYRGKGPDAGASGFLRQVLNANVGQNGMLFSPTDPQMFDHQLFIKLPFQESMPVGLFTFESVYAAEMHGYVVYFIFKSRNSDALARLEQSMQSFTLGDHCPPAK